MVGELGGFGNSKRWPLAGGVGVLLFVALALLIGGGAKSGARQEIYAQFAVYGFGGVIAIVGVWASVQRSTAMNRSALAALQQVEAAEVKRASEERLVREQSARDLRHALAAEYAKLHRFVSDCAERVRELTDWHVGMKQMYAGARDELAALKAVSEAEAACLQQSTLIQLLEDSHRARERLLNFDEALRHSNHDSVRAASEDKFERSSDVVGPRYVQGLLTERIADWELA